MGCSVISRRFGPSAILRLLITFLTVFAGGALALYAKANPPSQALEHGIKAAMLYKFLGYVDWPDTPINQASSPYRIWVLDAPLIEQELRAITRERTINERTIEVHKAQRVEQIEDAHMVFVGRQARGQLLALSRRARRSQFLVVTENDDYLPQGGTINLRTIEGRIGFDVSLTNAQRKQLRLSSRLLSLAASVERDDR